MSDNTDNQNAEEPIEDPQRRDLTISDAFLLGSHVIFLKFAGKHNRRLGKVEEGGILQSLETVQSRLVATDTALRVASQTEDIKNIIYKTHGRDYDFSTDINDDLGDELANQAETWEHLLSEELANENRIKISNTGILDLEKLMDGPENLFEPEIWKAMDDAPKRDISEACRSLPLGCATASLMVSLRSVEHYLRKWYEDETGEGLERGTWGSVLDDLIEIYTAEEDIGAPALQQLSSVPSVLSNLYYLKEKRDKVSHPDESPSAYESAITLFMVAGTISEVCREIGEVSESSEEHIK